MLSLSLQGNGTLDCPLKLLQTLTQSPMTVPVMEVLNSKLLPGSWHLLVHVFLFVLQTLMFILLSTTGKLKRMYFYYTGVPSQM